jgi:superfamily II DNA/RNA helicase
MCADINVESFDNLKLKDTILRGIYAYGWEKPSIIQRKSLPDMLNNKDMIIQACAGSGKTGVFTIGALNNIDLSIKKAQVVIISPTRELAVQTYNILCKLAFFTKISIALHRGCSTKNMSGEKVSGNELAKGYMSYGDTDKYKEQIVVATPGRLLDLLKRKMLNFNSIRMIVLDEADELLSPSNEFNNTISSIVNYIPDVSAIQNIIVSATIPSEVLELVNKITNNPTKILINNNELPLEGIQQYYVILDQEEDKLLCLIDIYSNIPIQQSIIFVNRKDKIDYIYKKMKESNFTVSCIYGTMSQSERDLIMNDFRNGSSRVLIATDLLARGIDVQSVSTVFNYDLPNNKENYIHRIGRSGRYGKKGLAINFVLEPSGNKPKSIQELEQFYSCIIKPLPQLDQLTE